MGRKAMPAQLQLLEGNKNRLTKAEIESRLDAEKKIKGKSDKVKPPAWLSKEAKKEFIKLAKELMEVDLISNVDVNALATYCDAYVDYMEFTAIITEEGYMVEYTNKAAETNKVPHPLLSKKKAAFEMMKSIANEFGFTPAARAKLAMPKQEVKEPNEFEREYGDV